MRRVALAFVSTISGLVVLLSFKTHSATVAAPVPSVSTTGPNTSSGSGSGTPAPSTAVPTTAASSPAAPSQTFTGDAVDTRWGPVQVRITVTNSKIAAVTAVEYPQNNPRDQQINAYAIPALNQETLTAGSAQIDMVSGATYTSSGYLGSLQSALDKAGL